MKRIATVVAESGQIYDLAIEPGTTARNVLNQMNLDERYKLTNGRGQEPFGDDENVYPLVSDGAKLIACTPVEVANEDQRFAFNLEAFLRPKPPPLFNIFRRLEEKKKTPAFLDMSALLFPPPDRTIAPTRNKTIEIGWRKPQVVQRDERPYWQERGWSCEVGRYRGYYRTRFGSWKGKATVSFSGRIDLYIHDPPHALEAHPHWNCFFPRDSGWYFIHNHGVEDLSSGILEVERVLNEAHVR